MSTSVQDCGIAAFAYAVAAWLVAGMVRGRHDVGKWLLALTMAAGATGFALRAPAVYTAVDRAAACANLSALLGALAFIGVGALIHLWIAYAWDTPDRRHVFGVLLYTAVVGAALIGLFATGTHPVEQPEDFATATLADPSTRAFSVLFAASFAVYWPAAALACRRVRRALCAEEQQWAAYGLRLVECGQWLATVYAAIQFAAVACALTGRGQAWALPWGNVVGLLSALHSTAGATCGSWGPGLAERRAPSRARRLAAEQAGLQRDLDRLWQLMAPQLGNAPLSSAIAERIPAEPAADFAVIRLLDGYRDLAAFLDDDVARAARRRARRHGRSRARAAAIGEAAAVLHGVSAKAEGRRARHTYRAPALLDLEDLDRCAAHLRAVARALPRRRSSAVGAPVAEAECVP